MKKNIKYDPLEVLICPKCGNREKAEGLHIQYVSVQFPERMIPITGPHIRLFCPRCGFVFYRLSLDED